MDHFQNSSLMQPFDSQNKCVDQIAQNLEVPWSSPEEPEEIKSPHAAKSILWRLLGARNFGDLSNDGATSNQSSTPKHQQKREDGKVQSGRAEDLGDNTEDEDDEDVIDLEDFLD